MDNDTWKSGVYTLSKRDPLLLAMPRSKVLKRDKYTCQACRKRFSSGQLNIHHIIPRAEGGVNDLDNLITLCWRCHDLIELAEPPIRSRQQILYHTKALDELERQVLEAGVSKETAAAWHAWVYGGARNPLHDA